MITKTNDTGEQGKGIRLEALLDMNHALVKLTKQINWSTYETAFGSQYAEDGRPGVPIRVMVGLHYLKYVFNESDESVVARWVENPYWQYVCGCETFQHAVPCHPSSMSRWRKRVGVDGKVDLLGAMEILLKEVLATAMRVGALKAESIAPRSLAARSRGWATFATVISDTTVQEKVMAFPTDAQGPPAAWGLYHKARRTLVRQAKTDGVAP